MKKENLDRGNDILRSIKILTENIVKLENQLKMLEEDSSGEAKATCQFMVGNYNYRQAKYDKFSLVYFINIQISKDQHEIQKLEKEFENL